MTPAKEVGGDFYDFFFIDDHRLAIIIADVSGKGVPAAIFMAMSRTLLKAMAMQVGNPGECLRRVNTVLSAESDPSMYVTVFYAVLNTNTGELQYSNGAHTAPYILRASGEVELLDAVGGTLVGMIEDLEFDVQRIALKPGDMVYMYTDGVTELMNERQQLFSESRLVECLKARSGSSLEELARNVFKKLKAFAGTALQSDDITMLVLRYNGR